MKSLSQYLPSKKFVKITGIIIACLVVVYFVVLYAKTYATIKNPIITTSTAKVEELLEKDTDGDGVRDWEEALWGTDPAKAATFGKPDLAYVESKKAETSAKSEGGVNTPDNITETDKIAREFLATIIALRESGNLNSFNISNLSAKFSSDIGADAVLSENYSAADLQKGQDTAVAKKNYYTKLTAAMKTAEKGGMGSELQVIANYFSKEVPDNGPVLKISATYATLTKALGGIAVPPSAASLHISLMNASDNMSSIFKNIVQINDNAIVGLIAIAQYKENEPKMEKAVADLITYFRANAIIK